MNRRRFALCALAALPPLLAACQDKAATPDVSGAAAPAASTPATTSGTSAGASDAFSVAAKGHGFTMGPLMAAHTVYVFFDPACPHCAHLWQEAQPLAGKLKIVWMPVQLLRNTSGQQGATIISAADPAAAMAQNEASVLARGPGIDVNPSLPDDALAKVKANTELFNQLGADSVPFIVSKNGTHAGAMSTGELAAFAGI